MTSPALRIGTRGSPMALAQADLVRDGLARAHPELAAPGALEIAVIKTTADKILDRTLADLGGKGLFTKEIEQALIDGRIDLAVHSMKDVPTWLPDGLRIACILPRDDPRDAFLSIKAATLAELPSGAVVGTSSLRRQAQILHRRPDLRVSPLRGNANTRLRKLAEGACDATLLAICGLRRIAMDGEAASILSVEEMLPAVAQGAIGVECRADDARTEDYLRPLQCSRSTAEVEAERALLAAVDGSCRTPVAALSKLVGDQLSIRGLLATPDGSRLHVAERAGPVSDARLLGEDAGKELRARAGAAFFAALDGLA